jgi:N-acetylglucosaminyl-diphospho-decaprenol L-rhamnosyltransferase
VIDRGAVDSVVVTSNNREVVLECLERLRDPAIGRTVVVDNASSDGTIEAIHEAFPDVETVRLDRHSGLSTAFNRGAARTEAPFLLFLNDDVFASEGAVSTLIGTLGARPDAASAGGRLVDADAAGATQDRYRPRRFPTLLTFLMTLANGDGVWPRNPWSGAHLRHPLNDRDVVEVDQPAGAALLVRRDAFEAIGGWDERFWFWYEDVDISRRLADSGPALYVPQAVFRHLGGGTVLRWSGVEIMLRVHHGILHYAQKHFSRGRQVMLGATVVAISVTAMAVRRDSEFRQARRSIVRGGVALIAGRPVPSLR